MLRKWEWIQEQCFKRGLIEPAKVAGEIDVILFENYDVEHTPQWIADYNNTYSCIPLVSGSLLRRIAANPQYCIACIVSDRNCRKCQFANLTGICGREGALYSRFFTEFYKAWKEGDK